MAGAKETISVATRQAIMDQFTDAIQSAPANRKSQLALYLADLQTDLMGMTGEQVSARVIQAIEDMKSIS